ncbi:DUF3107 domain-containing protein [Micrococcus cohnii]|uniref:Polysaccharide deacetylase 2 family uncharacterized protein YibQ n=1 Tax=Micrococcus cohnii TaxID=993416 RepID=A0A7W7GNU2_9MICC|nr:DUF3107 domain-containing protein [Micrococcus cohnii]MBB4735561.1 polysaccharide deacetylase 2 family uncharacterized protein YibQ [Micrococcus cohnii]
MEIRIGVQHASREVVLETEQSADEVRAAVDAALADGSVLALTDKKGRQVVVPGAKIAFVEIGAQKAAPLGFAAS